MFLGDRLGIHDALDFILNLENVEHDMARLRELSLTAHSNQSLFLMLGLEYLLLPPRSAPPAAPARFTPRAFRATAGQTPTTFCLTWTLAKPTT
jgi:hypothetical protein